MFSSCFFAPSQHSFGRLEKLEGNQAIVNVHSDFQESKLVTIELKDTLDCYLKTPLVADGREVVIYKDGLSEVDQEAVGHIVSMAKWVFISIIIIFAGYFILVDMVPSIIEKLKKNKPIKISKWIRFFEVLSVGSFLTWGLLISCDPHREVVTYGKISQINLDTRSCVIESEDGKQEYYKFRDAVYQLIYNADPLEGFYYKLLTIRTKETLIYRVRGGYILYQSFDKGRNIVEATMKYINKKTGYQRNIAMYIMIASILMLLMFTAIKVRCKLKDIKMQKQRAKIEEERLRQEALKQQELFKNCEKYVNEFWRDFMDSSEETSVLLARLRLKLEKSGYKKWRRDFYANVKKKANKYQRSLQEQRQNSSAEETDFDNFGDLLIDFRGVFVTPAQYQILSKISKARNLSRAQVLKLCRKLAKTNPEFASFKEVRDIQPYVRAEETNEAFRLFGLTAETLTAESLRQAYRRLVQKYHPDRNREPNAVVMFQKVQRYYAYLEGMIRC